MSPLIILEIEMFGRVHIIILLILLLQPAGTSAADNGSSFEMRGEIATDSFTWTEDNFAGFYYDLDDNIKTEELTTIVSEGNKILEPDGVIYLTTAQQDDFEFEDWGSFNAIGFMGEKYFAGYLDTPDTTDDVLFEQSDDENVLSDEQLLKILMDSDYEVTVTSGVPLELKEGYQLAAQSIDIDGSRVYLELTKDGEVVDYKVIRPSADYASLWDKTYYYKKDIGDSRDVVIIAVHFKNAFRGADTDLATVDGLWQLSDEPKDVSENTEYEKMTIQTVTADSIIMNNEDNDIHLSKNKDILLMPGISIKTADDDQLRYCVYKEITEPGVHELRGNVATDTFTWTADNFAGFYYDIDDNIKTEKLTATISDVNKLLEPDGINYTTTAQKDDFEYENWGYYNAIGFAAEKYLAGYIQENPSGTDPVILDGSDAINLLDFGILAEVLIDSGQEVVQDLSQPIELEEGYSLKLTVASDGKGLLAELFKDKKVIDKRAILLPGTYVYKSDLGNEIGVPLIAASLQEPIFLESKSYFKINGLWQISENPLDISKGSRFGIMTVAEVDPNNGVISLCNQDNDITLSKGIDIMIMPDFSIKTADADELRYCLVRHINITDQDGDAGSPGGLA